MEIQMSFLDIDAQMVASLNLNNDSEIFLILIFVKQFLNTTLLIYGENPIFSCFILYYIIVTS